MPVFCIALNDNPAPPYLIHLYRTAVQFSFSSTSSPAVSGSVDSPVQAIVLRVFQLGTCCGGSTLAFVIDISGFFFSFIVAVVAVVVAIALLRCRCRPRRRFCSILFVPSLLDVVVASVASPLIMVVIAIVVFLL